jgi:ubiquinone/menaquinone biosynthesis C-methylase UbiE
MDMPGLAPSEVIAAYRVLERVNRQLGHLQSLKRELRRSLAEDRFDQHSMTLLDVGSGSGDLPWELRKLLSGRAIRGQVLVLDRDLTAVQLASSRSLLAVQGDALHLPFPDRSLDLVTAVKFAHHFSGEGLTRLVSEMARVARCRVVILDIRRHWLAYWGFRAWSRLFTRSRLVRYDGPLSVLRGFTRQELADLGAPVPGFSWTVRSYAGFQLALIGRRILGSA